MTYYKDPVNTDYKSVDQVISNSDLFFHKLRGSVRMFLGRILTPGDLKKLLDKVLSGSLP